MKTLTQVVALLDEIERLAAELGRRDEFIQACVVAGGEQIQKIERLTALAQRYREALEMVGDFDCRPEEHIAGLVCWSCTANAALAAKLEQMHAQRPPP